MEHKAEEALWGRLHALTPTDYVTVQKRPNYGERNQESGGQGNRGNEAKQRISRAMKPFYDPLEVIHGGVYLSTSRAGIAPR